MPLVKDIESDVESDVKAAKQLWLPWRMVLLLIVVSGFVTWTFDHFGRLNAALPAIDATGMLGLLLFLKRKLLRRMWFWIAMAMIAALHVLVVFLVPWTDKWVPATAIAGIASLDLVAMLAIIDVIGRLVDGPKSAANIRISRPHRRR